MPTLLEDSEVEIDGETTELLVGQQTTRLASYGARLSPQSPKLRGRTFAVRLLRHFGHTHAGRVRENASGNRVAPNNPHSGR